MSVTRSWTVGACVLFTVLSLTPVAYAQNDGISIGPRLSFASGAEGSPEGAQRFSGGVIRFGGGRTAFEIAMDYRSGLTGDLTERIKDYPIQISTLIYPIRARLAPYVLGGIGWYSQRVQRLTGTGAGATIVDDQTTRTAGYHAGFGGEMRLHRRFGVFGDYRYTFLGFGKDSTPSDLPEKAPELSRLSVFPNGLSFPDRLKMSHHGTQISWGATFYF